MTDKRLRVAFFASFFFVGFVLGPSFAHLLELPNKIGLDRDAYFTVQAIYSGWALLGVPVLAALLATLVLAVLLRAQRSARRWAAVAFVALVATQAIFWTFTYPANTATENWTVAPENWEALRTRWEYSHAVAAVLNMVALLALASAALTRWRDATE